MKRIRIKRSHKKKSFPAPAFLPGLRGSANWHVREVGDGETPHTINHAGGEAEMALPLDDSLDSKFTRLHELLHAAHSPVEEPRPLHLKSGAYIDRDPLMIAEEFRINMVARRMLGGPDNLPPWQDRYDETTKALMKGWLESGKGSAAMEFIYWMFVLWPMEPESFGTMPEHIRRLNWHSMDMPDNTHAAAFNELINAAFEVSYATSTSIWQKELEALSVSETIPSWDSVLKLAEFIQQVSTAFDPPGDPSAGGSEATSQKEDDDIQQALDQMRQQVGVGPDSTPAEKVRGIRRKIQNPNYEGDGVVQWGKMKISHAKKIFRLPKNKLRRSKYRATDEGANPRYPHRMLSDGKVFSRKRKVPGGSVLIDDSGSMSWTTEELKAIIEAAPASIIAAYSGWSMHGELMIVAEDGQYADMTNAVNHPKGGGNIVDLPALEWLASQSKPRIWVSDTYVVPYQGGYEPALKECLDLVRDYDINICFTVEEAGQVFRGEREIHR